MENRGADDQVEQMAQGLNRLPAMVSLASRPALWCRSSATSREMLGLPEAHQHR